MESALFWRRLVMGYGNIVVIPTHHGYRLSCHAIRPKGRFVCRGSSCLGIVDRPDQAVCLVGGF